MSESVSFIKVACNFIKQDALEQVFSCEFCDIFKSNFFYRTPPAAASSLCFRLKPFDANGPRYFKISGYSAAFVIRVLEILEIKENMVRKG